MSEQEKSPHTDDVSWRDIEVEIAADNGPMTTRGLAHKDVPGLAVTMLNFGMFDVTHVESGMRIAGSWQRFGTACLVLARLAQLADWTQDADTVIGEVRSRDDEPVPFDGCTITQAGETRPCTVHEFMRSLRSRIPALDEFPWEAPDEDPFAMACDLLAEPEPERAS